MKRIVASIFLLITALFISKPFATELGRFYATPGEQKSYVYHQNYFVEPDSSGGQPLLAASCPCATPYTNPTIGLVTMAAVAAWVTMACFIYGSHFIAGLVAG